MIIKIGEYEDGLIKSWSYYKCDSDLKVYSHETKQYVYDRSDRGVFYTNDKTSNKSEWDSASETFDRMFIENSDCGVVFLTAIRIRDNLTKRYIRLLCFPNTVFIMNDEGKTIDRY